MPVHPKRIVGLWRIGSELADLGEPTDVWDNYPQVADIVGKSTNFEQRQAELDKSMAGIGQEYGDETGNAEAASTSCSRRRRSNGFPRSRRATSSRSHPDSSTRRDCHEWS